VADAARRLHELSFVTGNGRSVHFDQRRRTMSLETDASRKVHRLTGRDEFHEPLSHRLAPLVRVAITRPVSRVTNEKFVQTPRGVLHSSSSSRRDSRPRPARSSRAGIRRDRELSPTEDPKHPLTDRPLYILKESAFRLPRDRRQVPPIKLGCCRLACANGYTQPPNQYVAPLFHSAHLAPRRHGGCIHLVPAKDEAENLPRFMEEARCASRRRTAKIGFWK